MTASEASKRKRPIRRWIRLALLGWAVFATLWPANAMRTRGVDPACLRSDARVSVRDGKGSLEFLPVSPARGAGLVFLCGSGVAAEAYAPLLRPIAEAGFPVFIVKLPFRFAPLPSHKEEAVDRARRLFATHPAIPRWVLAGHSLGAALACRIAPGELERLSALVLIGTTHPTEIDLSGLPVPVTKIYGSNDGVAPPSRMFSHRKRLPAHTRWVEIEGGNHSQFGHYGRQLLDGQATVSRETQQELTRATLLAALRAAGS